MASQTNIAAFAAERLRELQNHDVLCDLVQKLREGVYVTSQSGRILDANPAFLKMLGVTSVDELESMQVTDLLVDPADRERELARIACDGSVRDYELRIRTPDGRVRTVLDSSYSRPHPETGEPCYFGILIDITDRKELEEQLREQSIRDPLTGSYNRRYLEKFQRQQIEAGQGWGCIAVDIDFFKEYNDRYGHHVGDDALIRISRYLSRNTRLEEGVVRMGGDEFVILLGSSDARQTEAAARRLTEGAADLDISFSVGWAARDNGELLEQTIQRADQRLLQVRLTERRPERRRQPYPEL